MLPKLKIKTFFITAGVISIFIISLYLIFVEKLKFYSSHLAETENNLIKMVKVANAIRHKSENLTKFARLYAVTKDKQYKENVERIVDIRNGLSNRPSGYIYWGLPSDRRNEDSQKRSIYSLIKELPLDDYELNILLESEKSFDELFELVTEAFNGLNGIFKDKNGGYSIYKEGNQTFAIELLHSNEYIYTEERVMVLLDQFFIHMQKRINQKLDKYFGKIQKYSQYIEYLSLLALIFLIYIFIFIKERVQAPTKKIVQAIEAFKKDKNSKDKLVVKYRDEIGLIAEQFNSMKTEIQNDLKELEIKDRELKEYIKLVDENIIISSTDLDGNITYVSQAFVEISGYSQEELIGKNHNIVRHPNMKPEVYQELWETITNDRTWLGEIENRAKNGESYWVKSAIYPKYYLNGKKVGYTSIRTNITDEKRLEKLLAYAENRELELQQYIDLVDESVITISTDLNGMITHVSRAFIDIIGYSKNDLIGKKYNILKNEGIAFSQYKDIVTSLTKDKIWQGEIYGKRRDKIEYWVDATIYPSFNRFGEKRGYIFVGIDITDKKRIEEISVKDDLTNLYNRRYFHTEIIKAIQLLKRGNSYLALIILEVDYFKEYNIEYGYLKGDEVLKSVATILRDNNRESFRLGSKQFATILQDSNPEEFCNFAKSLQEKVEALKIEHRMNKFSKYITISIGIAIKSSKDSFTDIELYQDADKMLSIVKKDTNNRILSNIRELK